MHTDGAPEGPLGRFHAMPATFYPCASVFIRGFNSLTLLPRRVSAQSRDLPSFTRLPWRGPRRYGLRGPRLYGSRRLPCCKAVGSRLKTAPCALWGCTERGRSSGVEHNLAKVGVEGSNPFARSSYLQENEAVKTVLRGRFLLPRPQRESWGSRGEAAESEKQRATGCRRHGGHSKATVCRLCDRRQWVASRSTTKPGFGRHRASQDAQARPILLHRRRWRRECETHTNGPNL
jgi:hypothetical protein